MRKMKEEEQTKIHQLFPSSNREKKFPKKEVIPATILLGDFSDYFHFYREISRFFTIMELSSFFCLFVFHACILIIRDQIE